MLRAPTEAHPWPTQVPPSAIDRFTKDRTPVQLVLTEPVVIEVSADTAWSGSSFRHALRFIRPRPDMHPGDVHP